MGFSRLLAACLLVAATGLRGAAWAQSVDALTEPQPRSTPDGGYTPRVGQEGKDVIWVPTPPALVTRMLQLAQTTPKDFVVDLGSGDGRIAIAAARQFGARAMGIEYNPDLVALSVRLAREAGVADRVQMVEGDIFEKDFSRATVVTTYLLPELNARLRPKLLAMPPGTRVVAHLFAMGDWPPDEISRVEGRPAFLWIVPAQVAGHWKFEVARGAGTPAHAFSADFEQQFQKVSGTLTFASGAATTTAADVLLRGAVLRFTVTDADGVAREYRGRVDGARMSGVATSGKRAPLRWKAVRSGE